MLHKGLYDHQLKSWYQNFQSQSFCVLSYEFLHKEPAAALEVVGKFLGLESFDWASHVVHIDSHHITSIGLTVPKTEDAAAEEDDGTSAETNIDEIPITEAVRKHIKAFLKVHGDKKYQLVKTLKYHGCTPSTEV